MVVAEVEVEAVRQVVEDGADPPVPRAVVVRVEQPAPGSSAKRASAAALWWRSNLPAATIPFATPMACSTRTASLLPPGHRRSRSDAPHPPRLSRRRRRERCPGSPAGRFAFPSTTTTKHAVAAMAEASAEGRRPHPHSDGHRSNRRLRRRCRRPRYCDAGCSPLLPTAGRRRHRLHRP